MSIVVYFITPDGWTESQDFTDDQFVLALAKVEEKRRAGCTHVCISSELGTMVGKPGVGSIVDGKTPDGQDYEWSKAGRAGRMKAADHEKTARDGSKE